MNDQNSAELIFNQSWLVWPKVSILCVYGFMDLWKWSNPQCIHNRGEFGLSESQSKMTSLQTTTSSSAAAAATGPGGGWVPLPPPSSPHFRTEFPSLEAAAQPSHRQGDHAGAQPQLRPQSTRDI